MRRASCPGSIARCMSTASNCWTRPKRSSAVQRAPPRAGARARRLDNISGLAAVATAQAGGFVLTSSKLGSPPGSSRRAGGRSPVLRLTAADSVRLCGGTRALSAHSSLSGHAEPARQMGRPRRTSQSYTASSATPPGRDLEDRAISVGAAVLGSPVKVPVGTLDEGRLGIGADPIEIRKSRESLCRRRNRPRTEQKGRAEPLHPANSAHIILLAALIFGHVDYT